jgi:hypothetical protein
MKPYARIAFAAFAGLIALFMTRLSADAQTEDRWKPFQFLLGSWAGVGSGKPGEASSGSTTFSYDLAKKIIVRKNKAEYPPKAGEKKGQVHEDLLIIYPQTGASQFRAIYFDNEGHVINYGISFPAERSAVFESETIEQQPRFRLTYETTKDGQLSVQFFVAPPGGELKPYVKGLLKRQE